MSEIIVTQGGTVITERQVKYIQCDICKKQLGPYELNSHGEAIYFTLSAPIEEPYETPNDWYTVNVIKPKSDSLYRQMHICGTACLKTAKLTIS